MRADLADGSGFSLTHVLTGHFCPDISRSFPHELESSKFQCCIQPIYAWNQNIMDNSVDAIAGYAHALRYEDLSTEAIRHCKRCLLDTLGVALAAFDGGPSRIARDLAQRASVSAGARVLGTGNRTLPELAAFANGVMVRYLDGNDCFPGGGGHPSDALPAILAAVDTSGADGRTVITSIVLAYEIYHSLWKASRFYEKGIDNVFYAVVGAAIGAAKTMGQSEQQMAETISLAITPNVPLDATRYGALSIWKGCASANAARNGMFAALLASAGMTGPDKPIEGEHGIRRLVGDFELPPLDAQNKNFKIEQVTIKAFASVSHALSPITAALQLTPNQRWQDISKVTLYTYHFAWEINGREPEKWRPATRESADHSLPYILAAVLIDGRFSDSMFGEERLSDPRIRTLIDKLEIKVDDAYTRQFPESMPCRLEVIMHNGERRTAEVQYPSGHYKNQMTDAEVEAKFREQVHAVLSSNQIEQTCAAVWQLDQAGSLDALFETTLIGKR